MAMIPLPPDFSEFLKLLNEHDVKYLLVGGYAVSYHGYIRATGDMNIWIRADSENAVRVVSTLVDFGFSVAGLNMDLFTGDNNVVRMGIPPVQIEILTSISGVEFDDCYESRIEITLNETPVNIISLDKLRKNKRASGRLRDLNDLEQLSLNYHTPLSTSVWKVTPSPAISSQ